MSSLGPTEAHHRDALIERAERAESASAVFSASSDGLRRLVPYDAAVWLATDPSTSMPIAPTRKENLPGFDAGDCMAVWEREFLAEDVNPYRELAQAESPAAGLRMSTGDRPARSRRFRQFLEPNGLGDELRAVIQAADGSPWAWISLYREGGRPAFGAREVELLTSLSAPLAEAMREHARPGLAAGRGTFGQGPGLMLFAPEGDLVAINDDALAWLEELPPLWGDGTAAEGGDTTRFGVTLPILVIATLMRARAIAEERDHGPARARMRSSATGRWLVCHASCLRDADGRIGNTALVIEPAKASEIAPIIAQAYALSAREQEITELISRGLATAAIAKRLHLSPHTVRDYIKAIFDKVGVSSRGELVASLFSEHYAPTHLDPDEKHSATFAPDYTAG